MSIALEEALLEVIENGEAERSYFHTKSINANAFVL